MRWQEILPRRKQTHAKWHDYSKPGPYFITICTRDRQHFFGEVKNRKMIINKAGQIVREEWHKLRKQFPEIDLDGSIIMPNHFHGIVIIRDSNAIANVPEQFRPHIQEISPNRDIYTLGRFPSLELKDVVRHFKGVISYRIHKAGETGFAWQRGFHDIIIKDNNDLQPLRIYMMKNPARWKEDSLFTSQEPNNT